MGVVEQSQDIFKPLPKEAFTFHGLICFPGRSQLTTPCVAEQKGQRYQSEEFFKFGSVSHVRVLKVKTPRLQVAEEQFNAPPELVEIKGFVSAKAVAQNMEMGVATAFAPNDFIGEEQIHGPNLQTLVRLLALAGRGMFMGQFGPDDGIGFDSHDVTNLLVIKIFEPFSSAKFAVHGQNEDLFGLHQAK